MMNHDKEHEERILGLAVGEGEDPGNLARIRDQLVECEECLSYGYGVLSDASLLRAALQVDRDGATAARSNGGLRLLERTLEEAMVELAERDAAAAEAAQGAEHTAADASDEAPQSANETERSTGADVIPLFRRRGFWGRSDSSPRPRPQPSSFW